MLATLCATVSSGPLMCETNADRLPIGKCDRPQQPIGIWIVTKNDDTWHLNRSHSPRWTASWVLLKIERLSVDLTGSFGRGFSRINLRQMRRFFLAWPSARIQQTVSVDSEAGAAPAWAIQQTASVESDVRKHLTPAEQSPTVPAKLQTTSSVDLTTIRTIAAAFPLPWSHYVKLLSVDDNARQFYEEEALRGGW